jgi:hypothetical protein
MVRRKAIQFCSISLFKISRVEKAPKTISKQET